MQSCVWKKRPKKNTSGGPSGDPFWDPKWPQIDVGGTKIAKIFDQKSSWNEFRIPDGPRIASGPLPGGGEPFWTRRERFTPHVRGSPVALARWVVRRLEFAAPLLRRSRASILPLFCTSWPLKAAFLNFLIQFQAKFIKNQRTSSKSRPKSRFFVKC